MQQNPSPPTVAALLAVSLARIVLVWRQSKMHWLWKSAHAWIQIVL